MITMRDIGINGNRFGNQISQYAALLGISQKTGYDFAIPYENENIEGKIMNMHTNEWIITPFKVSKCFDITAKNLSKSDDSKIINFFEENSNGNAGFDDRIFDINDNTDIKGYFQTEKYWKHAEELVRKELTFKSEFYDKASSNIENIRSKFKDLVSIHVRRDDYLANPNHPVLSIEYYQQAINNFNDKEYAFVVFSDDIQWCKDNFGDDERIFYSEGNIDYIDLCMMSLCDHNIIANSTFSWWAAWLNTNKDKRVFASKIWLGESVKHLYSTDLYCEGWEVI
tara:strand:+ start:43 stop:891 length:849 start_codon:yes stop_codon:yes gene_type:complete